MRDKIPGRGPRPLSGMPQWLFCLVTLFGFGGLAHYSCGEDPPVTLSLKTIGVGNGDFSGIFIQSEGMDEPAPLRFSPYHRSEPILYEGPATLIFFREIPDSAGLSAPIRNVVATYTINPYLPIEELLLFFLLRREAGGYHEPTYQVFGMDDGYKAFPGNSAVIFNATGKRLLGRINRVEKVFEPGISSAFPFKKKSLYAAFALQTRDGPKLVFENTLEFSEDQRVILVLRPPSRPRSMRIHSYQITEQLESGWGEPGGD